MPSFPAVLARLSAQVWLGAALQVSGAKLSPLTRPGRNAGSKQPPRCSQSGFLVRWGWSYTQQWVGL